MKFSFLYDSNRASSHNFVTKPIRNKNTTTYTEQLSMFI